MTQTLKYRMSGLKYRMSALISMKYDYLVVGCGLFGATFAQIMTEVGKSVLIIDKKNYIGGACYTENIKGINVHKYGAHIFHTSDEEV